MTGGKELKVSIDKYGIATVNIPNENWNGAPETFTFTATDPHGASASFNTTFTVKSVNDPPEFVEQIPDQTIDEKQQFKPILLEKYIKDIDHKFEQLKWTITGNKDLKIQIEGKEAHIIIPNALWNGSETISFKATDPEGAFAETQATFTVNSINDIPVFVKQIPSQSIDEKKKFAQINLDDFVKDADNATKDLSWEVNIKSVGKEPSSGPLNVNIDEKHVATIEIPDLYWNGSAVATLKVTDPEGASASQDVNLSVRSINDVPVFKKIADQTIDEKTEFNSFMLDDYLSDADNDISQLKIEVSGNKDLKVNVNNKTREVTVKTPDLNWNGSETVTFTATDPEGAKATSTAKFTVKSINDPPVLSDIKDQIIKEKQQFKAIALDNFVTDIDHAKNQLKWTFSGNKDIKISLDGERNATFSLPNEYWNGSEAIVFKVTDPEGASDERTVNFTVESINDPPAFVKEIQDQTIDEKKQFATIRLADIVKDPDHKMEDLVWSVDVKPAPGAPKGTNYDLQVNIDAKQVATIAIPDKNWNGSSKITFTVADPEGAKATSSGIFTVRSINDPPTLKEIANQSIDEKAQFAPINLVELTNDPDHSFDKLKWTFTGNKDLKVSVDKAGTATVSTPNALWNGEEKITFTVTDPEGATAKQTVVFTVKSINDVPVMKDIPSQTIKEKQQFKAIELDDHVKDLDDENAKLKWNITGNKELKFTLDSKRILNAVIPDKYWHGSETVKISVSDPAGATDSRSVTFTVESVNDAPEFVKKINDQTVDEKKPFAVIRLNDIIQDPDNKKEEITWSFEVKPAPGAPKNYKTGLKVEVDPKTQIATIVPPDQYWHGADLITFTATDPEGAKAAESALFTIRSINDPPAFKKVNDQNIVEKESFAPFNLAELVNDPDNSFSELKWTITGNKDLKVNIAKNGETSVTQPNKLWNGSEKITFAVSDPEGASARQTVTFSVKSVNDPPVMKDIPSQKIKEKQQFKPINLDDYVQDLDHPNNKLKWVITGNKALKFAMDPSHKVTITAPTPNWNGKESITFTVTDPEGATDSRLVNFEVESVNDAPEFVKEIQDQTIDEKRQFTTIKLDDFINDPDHKKGELKWTAAVFEGKSAPAAAPAKKGKKKNKPVVEESAVPSKSGLTVEIDNAHIAKIVIPNQYWNGAATIKFTATDPEGASATSSAKFTVRSINDIPQISDKAPVGETIREGSFFRTIDLSTLATDPDNSTSSLKWSITGNKDLKVVLNKDNTVKIQTPDAQWFGKEVITFTVTDPEGGKASQKMTFEVTEVNDPPVLSNIPSQKIKEKESFKPVKLDDFVKDPDNKPSEMKWSVSGNKSLKVEITSGRQLIVTSPNPYFWCAPETINLTVKDPKGEMATTTVTYEIISVNDPPVMKDIPPQKIKEKQQFKEIQLDNFVNDPDHRKNQLIWSATVKGSGAATMASAKPKKAAGKKKGKNAPAEEAPVVAKSTPNDMTVTIDENHVAHINLPSKYWNGSRTVIFTVTDPDGAKDSKSVDVVVESVNDLPVMKDIPTQTIKEKEQFAPIDLNGIASDPDNSIASLKFSISTPRALKATINAKNQLIVTTPDKFWNGSEKLTLTVTDPEGGRATQQVLFEVTEINDPPTISTIPNQKIKEKDHFEPINLSDFATDPDNRPNELTWTVSGNKALKADVRGSRVNIATPDPNWNGSETLTFTVTDPRGASASSKTTFTVTPVNDPPEFSKLPVQTINEKQSFDPIDISKFVSDPDNSPSEMKWSLDDATPSYKDAKGRLIKGKASSTRHPLSYDINDAGILTVTVPDKYWNGSDKVRVNAYDPSGTKATTEVNFVVRPINDPPTMQPIENQTTTEGKNFKPIKLDNYVTDPDNKPYELHWSVSGNRHLEVMITGGREALVKPTRVDWFGKEAITFIVTDPSRASAKVTANFEIKHVNAVPEIRPIQDVTIREDDNNGVLATIKLDQYVRDRDNSFNELKWTFTGNKNLVLSLDRVKNELTIKQPRPDWNGPAETITFTVTDPEGASAKTSAKFTVIPVNDPPVAMSQAYQTKESEPLKVNAREGLMSGATDPDDDKPSQAILVSKPQNGTVVINGSDGSFVYTPNKGFYGLDEFTFKLRDKGGAFSKPETAEINVNFKMKDIRGNNVPSSSSSKITSSSSSQSIKSKRRRRAN
ncbi:MAG: tandem-95 repeat protein [Fibrobacteraceae bacterium]|nr:tandem-95 repeat protein [Fibrobacteraceae bacterium]